MERVLVILGALQRGQPSTARTFAQKFGVSLMTIKRTLDLMRDRLGVPFEWDVVRGTYRLTRECETLPLLRIDAREALALALAGRSFEKSHGPAFGRLLGDLLRKVAPLFGGDVSLATDAIDQVISASTTVSSRGLDHFFSLFDAIGERRELRLVYTKAPLRAPATGERPPPKPEQRVVHPLHLAELNGGWTLIAYDLRRHAVRKFKLLRIESFTPTGGTFEPPPGFDAKHYVRASMGSFAGEEEYEVRLALDEHAAFHAREQSWHASQQLSERPDGRVEMTLRISGLEDAKHVALHWGHHVEILAPPALRAEVCAELKKSLAQYAAE